MRLSLYCLCLIVGMGTLAACTKNTVRFPPLSFTRYHPIYLNVSNIEFVEEYKSPLGAPNVEHLMPYSPFEAIKIWTKDRIRAVGNDKFLQIIIKDGSVKEAPLSTPEGIKGLLTISQDRRYDAILDVELRIYGGNRAMSDANVHVIAKRSITMSEDASAYTRDAEFRRMIADMMMTMNAELEKNMYQHMGSYINYSQNP